MSAVSHPEVLVLGVMYDYQISIVYEDHMRYHVRDIKTNDIAAFDTIREAVDYIQDKNM